MIGALRDDFRPSFVGAVLRSDPERVLERQGPDTRHPDTIRFTDVGQVREREVVVRSTLAEAMGDAAAGVRPPKDDVEPELPDELVGALAGDPELAAAFGSLTPGRQCSWLIDIDGAKRTETRVARIPGFRDTIISGTGATDADRVGRRAAPRRAAGRRGLRWVSELGAELGHPPRRSGEGGI